MSKTKCFILVAVVMASFDMMTRLCHVIRAVLNKNVQVKAMETSYDIEGWREQIRIAREAYKPDKIRCLLIAEAPPDKPDRFFIIPK